MGRWGVERLIDCPRSYRSFVRPRNSTQTFCLMLWTCAHVQVWAAKSVEQTFFPFLIFETCLAHTFMIIGVATLVVFKVFYSLILFIRARDGFPQSTRFWCLQQFLHQQFSIAFFRPITQTSITWANRVHSYTAVCHMILTLKAAE